MLPSTTRTRARWIASVASALTAVVLTSLLAPSAIAVGTTPTGLGSAAPYSVLAGAAATVPGSILPGEVGAIAAITGDAGTRFGSFLHSSNDSATQLALADATTAFTALNGTPATGSVTNDLGGQTLFPGVYRSAAAYSVTGSLTFDAQGDPDAVFVVQTDAALNTTAGITMNLANGAVASNIFWVVGGAVTLGASSTFVGTIIATAAITVGATSVIDGRAISLTAAITLDATTFRAVPVPVVVPVVVPTIAPTVAPVPAPTPAAPVAPSIAITGGVSAITRSATPTITGTTNAPAGTSVTVTISGTPITTTVSSTATWSVTPATARRDGAAAVVATITTSAGTATAKQTLIVDTIPPKVTISGGTAPFSAVALPTFSGVASEVPVGSAVTLTVAGRSYVTTVGANGAWTVPIGTALPEGLSAVVATATDRAGNVGTGTQSRTLDTIAPVISVTGGSAVLTKVARATLSGTTDAPAGSVVTVRVAGQTANTKVTTTRTWKVTLTTAVVDGTASAVITVADRAGNTGATAQTLTVDTTAPTLTVTGGATASTNRSIPAVSGQTDAPDGTLISVRVGTQTVKTVAGANGTWSVTPTAALAEGVVNVTATVADPAGNVRTTTQQLTVDAYVSRSSTTTLYFAAGSSTLSADSAAAVTALTRSVPAGSVRVKVAVFGSVAASEGISSTLAGTRVKNTVTAVRTGLAGTISTYGQSIGDAGLSGAAAQRVVVSMSFETPTA